MGNRTIFFQANVPLHGSVQTFIEDFAKMGSRKMGALLAGDVLLGESKHDGVLIADSVVKRLPLKTTLVRQSVRCSMIEYGAPFLDSKTGAQPLEIPSFWFVVSSVASRHLQKRTLAFLDGREFDGVVVYVNTGELEDPVPVNIYRDESGLMRVRAFSYDASLWDANTAVLSS